VDQSQLVDVDRDLRVIDRFQLLDHGVGQPIELRLVQGGGRLVGRFDGGAQIVHHEKKLSALRRAAAKASASSMVLYRAKEARALEVTPKRRIRGSAQWVPARTATPYRSRIW